uniref:uncharacterized protein LOC122589506 n=1 Tax=Erigeron canadensis TaxID=72917 RepID=UPI001CB9D0CC|nr:uncharacterized protein LOC122589506 [Erigeron canadensis]
MRSKTRTQNKPVTIIWIIKTPIRVLCKAKDYYIKGITNFSTNYNRPMMIFEEPNRSCNTQLPRSFSATMLSDNRNVSDQPSGGLIRASSTSVTQISIADIERYVLQKQNQELQSSVSSRKVVARNCSVAMVRIDEDRANSFRDDFALYKNNLVVNNSGRSNLSRNLSQARRL